jgi:hypothetical protein
MSALLLFNSFVFCAIDFHHRTQVPTAVRYVDSLSLSISISISLACSLDLDLSRTRTHTHSLSRSLSHTHSLSLSRLMSAILVLEHSNNTRKLLTLSPHPPHTSYDGPGTQVRVG